MLPHWSSVAMKLIHAVFEYPARMPITLYCFRTRMERDPKTTVRLKAEETHWRRSEMS